MIVAAIEDLRTGCTYIKRGRNLEDCVRQFAFMFADKRAYRVLWFEKEATHEN